jgi:hypothetical protein
LTWSIFQLIPPFETWITRNDVNGVSLYHHFYLINLMVYLCSQWTPEFQIKYFMFDWSIYRLFVINTACKRDSLHMMIFLNICSKWIMVEFKTRFESWITRNDVNGVTLFHLSYLITLKAYLCSQWTPNVQIKYFVFDWTIYNLLLLNTILWTWLLQIMIFIYVCFTWSIVELKNAFWDVNNKKLLKWCKFVSPLFF